MSEIDPYAPNSEEAVYPVAAPVETPAVEAPEAPVTEAIAVPEGSVRKVLDWVGEDVTRAQAALDAEKAGDKRTSLISKLNSVIN